MGNTNITRKLTCLAVIKVVFKIIDILVSNLVETIIHSLLNENKRMSEDTN